MEQSITLENEFLCVKVSEANGAINSIFLKDIGEELITEKSYPKIIKSTYKRRCSKAIT